MEQYQLKYYNLRLVIYIIALNVIGVLAIHSALNGEAYRVERQIAGICAGVIIMGIISFIPYTIFLKVRLPIYLGCCAFLVLVLVVGLIRGGARRWIVVPVLGQVQPSELAKVGYILFFAGFLGSKEDRIDRLNVLLPAAAFALLPIVLILLEPDTSSTIILCVILASMFYVSGVPYKYIGIVLLIVVPLIIGFLLLAKNGLLDWVGDYRIGRILAWFDKSAYTDANLQQDNSIMAIASGKMFGKGLNYTGIESVKSGSFLAESQTDFIFAVIGEELGFIGSSLVVLLFALIVIACLRMGGKCEDMQGKLICTGVGILMGMQSFTNIAVTTGLFPNTGLPLPFISYGVSSLLSNYIAMGFVLNAGLMSGNKKKSTRYIKRRYL